MCRKLLLLASLVILTFSLKAQDIIEEEKAFEFGASYTGDFLSNFSGGIKRGTAYLGLAGINLSLNTGSVRMWKGGTFHLNISNTHGQSPSEELIGDIQVASNIEAGKHTFLEELWYKQVINNFEFTIGLQDLNLELATVDCGDFYLNSSFGILPIISLNLHAPIFPLTAPGITTKWNINDKMSWLNAIYDGSPTDFEENPHNLKWQFKEGDGLLMVSEFQNRIEINGLPGIYKFGIFAHDHFIERNFFDDFPDSLNTNTAGTYLNYEQKLWQHNDRCFNAFIHTGYSPSEFSLNKFYLGMGINAKGFLNRRKDDIIGISGAYAKLREDLGHESVIELTWKKQITDWLFIQPDFQYIFHPSGSKSGLKNATVGILRFEFEI